MTGRAAPPWPGSRGSPPGSPWPPWTSSRPATPDRGTISTRVYPPLTRSPGWYPSCRRRPRRGAASCRAPPAAPTWSCHNIHTCLYHNTRPCPTWSPPRQGLSRTARSWWRGTPGLGRARRAAAARPAQRGVTSYQGRGRHLQLGVTLAIQRTLAHVGVRHGAGHNNYDWVRLEFFISLSMLWNRISKQFGPKWNWLINLYIMCLFCCLQRWVQASSQLLWAVNPDNCVGASPAF